MIQFASIGWGSLVVSLATVPFRRLNAKGLHFSEQGARGDRQLRRSRAAISLMSAQCVLDEESFGLLQRHSTAEPSLGRV
jgi:hypothetical protein